MAELTHPRRYPVIVSMTTIPSRLPFVGATLECILGQSFTDFNLHLYIPRVCRRNNERYEVPDYLAGYGDRLNICRIDTDYGPATKLLGPLQTILADASPEGDWIITVDDDVLLERHAIEELVAATRGDSRTVIGFMGVSAGDFIHAETLAANGASHASVSILGGYRGVLYPVDVLDRTLFGDHEALDERCGPFLDDDHLIAWNLARRGIPRHVIATRHPGPGYALNLQLLHLPEAITFGTDSGSAVDDCHRALIEYYREMGWEFPT